MATKLPISPSIHQGEFAREREHSSIHISFSLFGSRFHSQGRLTNFRSAVGALPLLRRHFGFRSNEIACFLAGILFAYDEVSGKLCQAVAGSCVY
jgi:hypothetical protein